jgi:hypothetical protein
MLSVHSSSSSRPSAFVNKSMKPRSQHPFHPTQQQQQQQQQQQHQSQLNEQRTGGGTSGNVPSGQQQQPTSQPGYRILTQAQFQEELNKRRMMIVPSNSGNQGGPQQHDPLAAALAALAAQTHQPQNAGPPQALPVHYTQMNTNPGGNAHGFFPPPPNNQMAYHQPIHPQPTANPNDIAAASYYLNLMMQNPTAAAAAAAATSMFQQQHIDQSRNPYFAQSAAAIAAAAAAAAAAMTGPPPPPHHQPMGYPHLATAAAVAAAANQAQGANMYGQYRPPMSAMPVMPPPAESPVSISDFLPKFASSGMLISPKGANKPMGLPSPSSSSAGMARFSSSDNEEGDSRSKKKQKMSSNATTEENASSSKRTNLNDLVTVVEQAVLTDMGRMDRFADKVTVLECTARMLHEKYGMANPTDVLAEATAEYDSDSGSLSNVPDIDLTQASGLDRNTKKTLRERQRRRSMNKHLLVLRKMLNVDDSKDKKAVLNTVIEFLHEKRKEREQQEKSAASASE